MIVVIMWAEGKTLTEEEFTSYKENWIANEDSIDVKAEFLSQLDYSDIEGIFSGEIDIKQRYSVFLEMRCAASIDSTIVEIAPGQHLYVDYYNEEYYIGENTLPFEIYTFEEE